MQISNIILFILRLFFASLFTFAAIPKLQAPFEFSSLVAQYQILPLFLINAFSAWLPAFEVVIALGLIFTPFVKQISRLLLVLMILFIIALAQALIRDLGITCGCFSVDGAQNKSGAWFSLIRDIVFLPFLIWMSFKIKNKWLWKSFEI